MSVEEDFKMFQSAMSENRLDRGLYDINEIVTKIKSGDVDEEQRESLAKCMMKNLSDEFLKEEKEDGCW